MNCIGFVFSLVILTNQLTEAADLLGCYFDSAENPDFYISASSEGNIKPENCVNNCVKLQRNNQNIKYAGIQIPLNCLCADKLQNLFNDTSPCSNDFNLTGQQHIETEVYAVKPQTGFTVKLSCEVNEETTTTAIAIVTCSVKPSSGSDIKYSFNFDDGSFSTNVSNKTSYTHEYYLPGEYTVSVAAVGQDGFYTLDYEKVTIQKEVTSPNFEVQCPTRSLVDKFVTCNLTSFTGSGVELKISSSDTACPRDQVLRLPDVINIPVGAVLTNEQELLNNSLLKEDDEQTFMVFRHTVFQQEGRVINIKFYLAIAGQFKLWIIRPILPPTHCFCTIDDLLVTYSVQHEFKDIGDFRNEKTPKMISLSIPDDKAPHVLPGDVIAYSPASSGPLGVIGYQKIENELPSDFFLVNKNTTAEKLRIIHSFQAILSPNTTLALGQPFENIGSCSFTSTLQSKKNKITSNQTRITVVGLLEGLKVQCPEYIAVESDAEINVSISTPRIVSIEWNFGEGKPELILETETKSKWSKIYTYNQPGKYKVSVNISTSYLSISDSCLIAVQIPISEKDWKLNSDGPKTVPGNISFILTFDSTEQFPTNVSSIFYWGDGTQTKFDVETKLLIKNYLYIKPNVYLVSVQLFNKISEIHLNTSVEISGDIFLKVTPTVYMEYCNCYLQGYGPNKNIFRQFDLIKLTAVLPDVSNYQVQWMNGSSLTYARDNNELLITFNQIQNVSIIYSVTNEYLGPITYTVELIIFDVNWMLDVFMSDFDVITNAKATKNFSFHTTNPKACVLVDYGDSSSLEKFGTKENCRHKFPDATLVETEKFPVNASHLYQEKNNYNVTLIAFTATKNRTKREPVLVGDYPFKPKPTVWIQVNETAYLFPLVMPRSQYKRIETGAEIAYNSEDVKKIETKMFWTIWSVDENGNDEIDHNWIDDYDDAKNKSYLFIHARFLPYGLYKVIYNFSIIVNELMDTNFPLKYSVYTYLKIVESELAAVMIENSLSYIERSYGQLVDLDPAGLSIDPDNLTQHDFKVLWICKQSEETYDFEVSSNKQDVPAPSEGHASSGGQGGCFGKGPGLLNIPDGKLSLNTSSFYKPNINVTILVKIELGKRFAFTKLKIQVFSKFVPILDMQCSTKSLCHPTKDGFVKLNPSLRLSLIGRCLDCGGPKDYELWWDFSIAVPDSQIVGRDQEMMALSEEFIQTQDLFSARLLAVNETSNKTLASAEIQFKVDKPPVNGTCKVIQPGTYALIDFFHVSCENWIDPDGRGIQLYKTTAVDINDLEITIMSCSFTEMDLILRQGYIRLYVDVTDVDDSITRVNIGEFEVEIPSHDEFRDFEKHKIDYFRFTGNQFHTMQAIQVIYGLQYAYGLSKPEESSDDHTYLVEQTTKYLEYLDDMNVNTINDLEAVSRVGSYIVGDGYSLDTKGRKIAVMHVKKWDGIMSDQNQEAATFTTPYRVHKFVINALSMIGAVAITTSNMLARRFVLQSDINNANEIDYDTAVKIGEADVVVPSDENEVIKRAVLEDSALQARRELDDIDKMMETISKAILNNFVAGEKPLEFFTFSGLVMRLERSRAGKLSKNHINVGNASFQFPDICKSIMMGNECTEEDEFAYGAILWSCIFPAIGKNFYKLSQTTTTVDLDLYSGRLQNLTQMLVSNISEDIQITIPKLKESAEALENRTSELTQPKLKWFEKMMYHKIHISNPRSSLSIQFSPTEINPGFLLFIRYKKKPLLDSFDLIWDTSNLTVTDDNTYFIFVSNADIMNRYGDFYLGVVQKSDVVTELDINNRNISQLVVNTSFTTEYTIKILLGSCFYFLKEMNSDEWRLLGCRPTGISKTKTTCSCNHLTKFSTAFATSPASIDFVYVLSHASFNDNTTIYATIIATFTLFILFLIWARYKDRKDVEKLGALPLPDNKPQDKYLYEILVFTGTVKESGTDSKISFIVSGEKAESDVRTFGRPPRRAFDRGSVDVFVMAEPRPLGQLQYLRIWHDNSGENNKASWYLNYIIFRDVQTGEKFEFIAESWFAVELGDREIDRLIPVADKQKLKEFGHLFSTTGHKTFTDGYLWLSIFLREPRNRFTRCQRVATCVALLYLSMLANAMWYETAPDAPITGFTLGPFALNLEQLAVGFVSQLIIFPVVFFISFLFRRSKPFRVRKSRIDKAVNMQGMRSEVIYNDAKFSKPTSPIKYKRTWRFNLPWWFKIIAWILCISAIAVSIFFLWAYAIQFGETKTRKWLTSFVVSFFTSLLITQPIMVLLYALFFTSICKKVETDQDDADEDEEDPHLNFDEQWLHQQYNPLIYRKAFLKNPDYSEAFQRSKILRQKEVQTRQVLKELAIYIIFVWILAVISSGINDSNAYWMVKSLKDRFVDRKIPNGRTFLELQSTDDYWMWASEVLMLQLRVGRLYDSSPPFGMRGFLRDRVNRIMGNAILRQVRLKQGVCQEPKSLSKNFSRCSGEFTHFINEDDIDYDIRWEKLIEPYPSRGVPEYIRAFNYKTASELNGYPFWGTLDNYGGGGYVYELKARTEDILRDLKILGNYTWIDEYTRALFVEFSVYNAQVNLFGVVSLSAEFFPGGGIVTDYEIAAIQLLAYENDAGLFLIFFEIVFILFIIHFTIKECRQIFEQGRQYFHSYGNINEIFILLFAYTSVAVYIYRIFAVAESIAEFNRTKGSEYINLQRSKFFTDLFSDCFALCTFLSILKFIKLLRFNHRIATLSHSLRQSANDLGGFAVVFTIFFLAYTVYFFIIYTQTLSGFATFYNSIKSLLRMTLNRFEFHDYIRGHPVLGPIIFFSFTFITSIILINLLLTIIIVTFERVKREMAGQTNQFEVIEFIVNGIKHLVGRGPVPPKENSETKQESVRKDENSDSKFQDKMDRMLSYVNTVYFDNKLDWQKSYELRNRGKNNYFPSSTNRVTQILDEPQKIYNSN